ncbi:hypothetical protein PV797_04035 [Clostridiaceae bacterium M8S5]|nr:hypothetical protein PV797_04035 [Clostridiaceae bacterium M8S5]
MKKKVMICLIACMFIIGLKTQANAQQDTWKIYKDEKLVEIKNQPFSEGDEIFFPLVDMFGIIGFDIEIDKYGKIIVKDEDSKIGYYMIYESVVYDAMTKHKTTTKDNTLYVDSSFIENNMFANIKISKNDKKLYIDTKYTKFIASLHKMSYNSGRYEIVVDEYCRHKDDMNRNVYEERLTGKTLCLFDRGQPIKSVFKASSMHLVDGKKTNAKLDYFYCGDIKGFIVTIDGMKKYGKDFNESHTFYNGAIRTIKECRWSINSLISNDKVKIQLSNIGSKNRVKIITTDNQAIACLLNIPTGFMPNTKSKLEFIFGYDKNYNINEFEYYISIDEGNKTSIKQKVNLRFSMLKNINELDTSLVSLVKELYKEEFDSKNAYEVIKFNDKAFENIVRDLLNKPKSDIYGYELYSLKSIDIDKYKDQKIKSIKDIENMPNLELVRLDDNLIKDITPLKKLKKIKKLSIKNNLVEDISCINYLTDLQEIDFEGNKISEIPRVDKLTDLVMVNLSNNKISDISNIQSMKHVKKLNLSTNNISSLKALEKISQGEFNNLENLNLENNNISNAKYLSVFTNLKSLNLENNKVTDLSNFDDMNLEYLNLSVNGVQDLSKLKKTDTLKAIKLSFNKIKDITPLKNLEVAYLYLDYNEIKRVDTLPMKNLKCLAINNNQIEYINEELFKDKEMGLINISYNKIKNIDFISKLKYIQLIYVEHNQIKKEDIEKYKDILSRNKD